MTARLLMAHRGKRGETEAEPVVVDLIGETVVITLDDADEVVLDLRELLAAAYDDTREAA